MALLRDGLFWLQTRAKGLLRDWGNVLVFILGLWVITGSLWFWFGWGSQELRGSIADYGNLPISISAALLAWRTARHAQDDRRMRRAWNVVALAFLCTAAGDVIWLFYEKVLHLDPFPSWADAVYLLYYPALFLGLLLFPGAARNVRQKVQFALDTGTILVGSWMVVCYFIIDPTVQGLGADPLSTVMSVAYCLGDMALLCGVTVILLRQGEAGRSRALTVLAAGIFVYVVGDLAFSYLELHQAYQSGGPTEPLWFIAAYLMGLSAHYQYLSRGREQQLAAGGFTVGGRNPFSLLPYAAVVISYGLLLAVSGHVAGTELHELIYGAVVVTGLVVVRQFVTARENLHLMAESAARRSEARFGSLVRNSSDVITIIDADFTIVYQSPSVERIFGYAPTQLIGSSVLTLFHPDEAALSLAVLQQLVQQPGVHKLMEWQWFHKDGSVRHTETIINNLLADENVRGLVLNTRDITERKQLEAQIRHQAFHDTLTNLANRALFKDRVEQALSEQGQRKEPVTVLFLDLDNFKTINDSLGHTVGDQLLSGVAERILACVRATDTVARLGGDEFAVLLKWMATGGAVNVAERITVEMKKPFLLQGREVCISVSVGIATNEVPGARADELLRNADVAMYVAKARGKGRCEVYHPSMYSAVRDRMELEAELRRAADGEQLVLFYQPTVDLASGRIAGVEALVRWRHPQRGLLQPGQFIPLAEETELIVPIGQWVMRQACLQLKRWQEQFPGVAPQTVGVNLSVKQLHQADLAAQVQRILAETGLPARCLVLEITESILMHGTELFLERLKELRSLGVQLAIDDFGTGYSSLSYLRWVPVDVLKMDKSFVRGIENSPKGVSLVNGIINLAEALGLETVAEGIERMEQLAELQAMRCHLGQGYFFGSPVDADGMAYLWSGPRHAGRGQAAG